MSVIFKTVHARQIRALRILRRGIIRNSLHWVGR